MKAARRVTVASFVGVVIAVALAPVAPWQVSVLCGWDGAAATFLVVVWSSCAGLDPEATRTVATHVDDTRVTARLVLLAASIASLVGVAIDLVKAGHASGAGKFLLTAVAVMTVAASWAVVHS